MVKGIIWQLREKRSCCSWKEFGNFTEMTKMIAVLLLISLQIVNGLAGERPENGVKTIIKLQQDSFKYMAGDGEYKVNYMGLTDEKNHNGEKVYKFDITFKNGSYCNWYIPVSIPVEDADKLLLSTAILVSGETTCGVRFGANLVFPRIGVTSHRPYFFDFKRGGYQRKINKWLSIRDNFSGIMKNPEEVCWGAGKKDFNPVVDKIIVSFKVKNGSRAVVYLSNIVIDGAVKTRSETAGNDAADQYRKKINRKLDCWNKILVQSEAKLKRLKADTVQYRSALAEIRKTAKLIAAARARGMITRDIYLRVAAFINLLDDIVGNIEKISRNQENIRNGFCYIIDRPISSWKILPDSSLLPGTISNTINLRSCRGEFEPASFVVCPVNRIDKLSFEISDLAGTAAPGESGQTISHKNLDIRSVKCWFVPSLSWESIKSVANDRGMLAPELLLKDDSLIKTDPEKHDNYLKLGEKYVCISSKVRNKQKGSSFLKAKDFPVEDSSFLRPLSLPAKKNKQFWLTIRTPENALPGLYRGTIKLLSGTALTGTVNINLTVLPFKLSEPRTFYSAENKFTPCIYYRGMLGGCALDGSRGGKEKYISSIFKTGRQYQAELKDMVDHGIRNTIVYDGLTTLNEAIKLRKTSGMPYDPLYIIGVGANGSSDARKKVMNIAAENKISEVYFYGLDEAHGDKLKNQRKNWESVHEMGAKVIVTGMKYRNYKLMGDIQDLLICAFYPSVQEAGRWHSKGHKIWIYGYPFGGVLNPELFRRNYGLLAWKNSYDGICPFAYQQCGGDRGSVWNGFDSWKSVKDQNFSYPTVEKPINTVSWEALREGIKDVKYASALQQLVLKYKNSENKRKRVTALKAEKFLNDMDAGYGDLNSIREKIIELIMELR